VRVRAGEEFRAHAREFRNFTVALGERRHGGTRKLVRVEEGERPASIDRLNRQRQVTISANLAPGGSEADARRRPALRAGVEHGGRAIARASRRPVERVGQRANQSFMLAFALSFVFMYMMLAAQFESFIHPVTILLTLPLSIPFGICQR
jgi:HAE1 family hydrophobic/amphiphilic exporter-1